MWIAAFFFFFANLSYCIEKLDEIAYTFINTMKIDRSWSHSSEIKTFMQLHRQSYPSKSIKGN